MSKERFSEEKSFFANKAIKFISLMIIAGLSIGLINQTILLKK